MRVWVVATSGVARQSLFVCCHAKYAGAGGRRASNIGMCAYICLNVVALQNTLPCCCECTFLPSDRLSSGSVDTVWKKLRSLSTITTSVLDSSPTFSPQDKFPIILLTNTVSAPFHSARLHRKHRVCYYGHHMGSSYMYVYIYIYIYIITKHQDVTGNWEKDTCHTKSKEAGAGAR